jgi:DnaJ-class molecular chaperone
MFGAGFGGAGTYSSSRSSRPRGPPRKKDSIVQYAVTLEELYNGKKVRCAHKPPHSGMMAEPGGWAVSSQVMMNLERQGICGTCEGCVRELRPTCRYSRR